MAFIWLLSHNPNITAGIDAIIIYIAILKFSDSILNVKKSFANDSFFGSVYINEIEFPYNKNDLGLIFPENQDFFFVDSILI